ncbi:mitochondrial carrier domain-containing protein [Cyclospora cayetanensis]|uniref:Mitochondrial carrier domain-containing protein n=1 Tax=Cyclospora cayetanensis TaxID=88456 RepID=A0A1D3CW60_9EIME|nr:mitochondrial carrier domain-containing protein [Cyclospora cayetanensis]
MKQDPPDPGPSGKEGLLIQARNSAETASRRNSSSAAIFGGGTSGSSSSTLMGIYGALSSCAAAVALQPLDVIKTRQQQQGATGVKVCIRTAAGAIHRQYGLLGFWRGSIATVLRVAPGTGLYFSALGPMMGTWGTVAPLLRCLPLDRLMETSSKLLPFSIVDFVPVSACDNSFISKALTAILGGVCGPLSGCLLLLQLDPNVVPAWYLGVISGVARGAAVVLFNPISIVKTRMESSLGSGSMMQSFWHLLRHEPPLNWCRGSLATIFRDVPFSGLFFVVYVHLKGYLGVEADSRENVNFYALQNFACGAAAAATASAITHPFDVLRTRLQLDAVAASLNGSTASGSNSGPSAIRHQGIMTRVAELARTEGPSVLWRGLGIRLLKRSLMAALTWTSFEEIKTAASGSLAPAAAGERNG